MRVTTKNGRTVWLVFNPDCEYNTGGFWVEIYEDENLDCRLDDFCIHPEDCDCKNMDAVEWFALGIVSNLVI